MLKSVLEKSLFFQLLDSEWGKSGKPKSDFRIAVKPNLTKMIRKGDDGNYHENRSVLQVAAKSGYIDESFFSDRKDASTAPLRVRGAGLDATVPLVDLTLDTLVHDFGHPTSTITPSTAVSQRRRSGPPRSRRRPSPLTSPAPVG